MTKMAENPFKISKLFNYCEKNNNMQLLNDILGDSSNMCNIYNLYCCYEYLCKNNMTSIIYDIMEMPTIYDEYFISMIAIDKNLIDILESMIQKGFNFNETMIYDKQMIWCCMEFMQKASIFDYCLKKNNIEMFKFFVNCKIDLTKINPQGIDIICKSNNKELFDYYIKGIVNNNNNTKTDYPHHILHILANCCNYNSYEKIVEILKLGLNIADNSPLIIEYIANGDCDLQIVKLLIDHGLIADSNLLANFCSHHNDKLDVVEFLLNYGIKPDPDTIKFIFRVMKIPIIKLFLKYGIDLSLRNDRNINTSHLEFINQLENNGINKDVLLYYFLDRCDEEEAGRRQMQRMQMQMQIQQEHDYSLQ